MPKLLSIATLLTLFTLPSFAQVGGWDTLDFRAPLSSLSHSLRQQERLLTTHTKGISYSDDYGESWQKAQNAPKDPYSFWYSEGKIYASNLRNGQDSTWVSNDNGLNFTLWDTYSADVPAFKVIHGDTLLYVGQNDNRVLRKIKSTGNNDLIYTTPGFNTILQLTSIGDRLILLSTDGIRWSDDGGLSWVFSIAPPINNLCIGCDRIVEHQGLLFFHNRSNVLLRSNDAGLSWESLPFFQQNPDVLLRYVISEGNDLLAATYNHVYPEVDPKVWRSTDLGNTWQVVYPEIFGDEYFLAAYPTPVGKRLITSKGCYAVSNNDSIWETRNAGLPKTPLQLATRLTNGTWVVAVLNRLFRTENDGQTYRMVHLNKYNYFGSIERLGNTLLATPPDQGGFLRSDDGGILWHIDSVPGETVIYRYCQENPQNLLVLFNSGALYRYQIPTSNWEYLSSPGQVSYLTFNNGILFTEGQNGVRASSDFGQTFTLLNSDFSSSFQCGPLFSFGNSVLVSGLNFEVYVTNDLGVHWTPAKLSNGLPLLLLAGDLAVDGDALAAYPLYGGLIYFSDNGGLQWYESAVPVQSFGFVWINFLKQFEGDLYASFRFNDDEYFIKKRLQGLAIDKAKGRVFQDINQNEEQDSGEPGMPNVVVSSAGDQYYTLTDQNGDYTMAIQAPVDTITPVPPYIHYTAVPEQYIVNGPADSLDFAINTNFHDLELQLGSGSQPRPGFEQVVAVNVFNAGLTQEKCRIKALFDPLYTIEETIPPATMSGDTLIWQIDSLASYTFQPISVKCRLLNTAPIGMPVFITASVTALSHPDDFPENNQDTLVALIVGSFDPNDKTALTGKRILKKDIENGKRLEYQIRFQNTGNFPASFVRIRDTLAAEFSPQTFKLESASHPVVVEFAGPRVLDFFFPQINLPDSNSNEAESHGFLRFSIEAQRNLNIGDSLRNHAAIYFDYNPPVITNDAITLVSSSLGTPGNKRTKPFELSIVPNPAPPYRRLILRLPDWVSNNTPAQLRIYDSSGRLHRQNTALSVGNLLVLDGLSQGSFLILANLENRWGVCLLVVE